MSIARLTQRQTESGAALDLVTHECAAGAIGAAVEALERLGEVQGRPAVLRVDLRARCLRPARSSATATGSPWGRRRR